MTEQKWSPETWAVYDLGWLEEIWLKLQVRSVCSYFQTWGWIGTWLSCIPAEQRPAVLSISRNGDVVGLCALGTNRVKRRLASSRSLFINESGMPSYDRVTMEHNGILAEREDETSVIGVALKYLTDTRQDWEEIFLSGVDDGLVATYQNAALACGLRARVASVTPFYIVDLDKIRRSQQHYLGHLSANTRYQIRRSKRAYLEQGEVHVRAATDLREAQAFLDDLKRLHQSYWERRAEVGAFGTEFSWRFHQTLVETRFPHAEIQLLRIAAGDTLIGYMYNFLHNGVVYNYQTGFVYPPDDSRMKPGLLSHAEAIEYNLIAGLRTYDLLMGNHRYKTSLSTDTESMSWLRVQRPKLKFHLEDAVYSLRDRVRRLRS